MAAHIPSSQRALHPFLLTLAFLPASMGQTDQCSNVTAAQVAGLDAYSCSAIDEKCFGDMPEDAFKGFSEVCVSNWNGNGIQGITAKQLSKVPKESFGGWSSNIEYMGPACAGITADQASYLTDEHACEALGQDCFTAMTPEAYGGFTKECVANWRENELGASVTAKDISAIDPKAVKGLNDHDISVWTEQCAGFSEKQLVELTDLACSALSAPCLQSIPDKSCKGLFNSKSGVCQTAYQMCGKKGKSSGSGSSLVFAGSLLMNSASFIGMVSSNIIIGSAKFLVRIFIGLLLVAAILASCHNHIRRVYLMAAYEHVPDIPDADCERGRQP
ncbi:hypothetical protein AAMO2058_001604000 [Amorphochlora amoebiformis]